jgi:hypothetical protein
VFWISLRALRPLAAGRVSTLAGMAILVDQREALRQHRVRALKESPAEAGQSLDGMQQVVT